MKKTKGIILAGGKATRLFPVTLSVSKQLLPIYDKPMIYYPLSVLMLAGIREILIITTEETLPSIQNLFGDGKSLGLKLQYKIQDHPRGLADAFLTGEDFIGEDQVCLILGDNVFYGDRLQDLLKRSAKNKGATIFCYYVTDPQRYGIVSFNKQKKVTSIEEKPKNPKSNWAITGIYFFDHRVVNFAKKVKPSKRGELEITDVIRQYLPSKSLNVVDLGRGFAWLDTGTFSSLIDASTFIKTVEERQGLKIGCIEEIAFRKGFINSKQLANICQDWHIPYGDYLKKVLAEKT